MVFYVKYSLMYISSCKHQRPSDCFTLHRAEIWLVVKSTRPIAFIQWTSFMAPTWKRETNIKKTVNGRISRMNRNTNPLKSDLYQVGITMSLCGISLPDRSVLQYFIVIPPQKWQLVSVLKTSGKQSTWRYRMIGV